jgi:hypothetical protein
MLMRRVRSLRSTHRYRPLLESLEDRAVPSAGWSTFGGNAQHTGDSPVTSQPVDQIEWQPRWT